MFLGFRRQDPIFAAFDLLAEIGAVHPELPLIERKQQLRRIVPVESPRVLHVDSLPEKGRELFALACEQDLEGIVGKRARGRYQSDGQSTSWVKVKNR